MSQNARRLGRSRHLWTRGLALLLPVLALACGPEEPKPDAGTHADAACTLGTLGCDCLTDGTCLDDAAGVALQCVSGTCQQPACDDGALGCACLSDGSCSDEQHACNTDNVCELAACPPGTEGCRCLSGGLCSDDSLMCGAQNLCVPVVCPLGREGCACQEGGHCGVSAANELLTCDSSNVCMSSQCAPGQTGCACLAGYQCVDDDVSCRDGYCMPDGCSAGTENCACAGGGCNPGLLCQAGRLCVDGTGSTGGPCDASGGCLRGNRCQDAVCVPCSTGTQACGCNDQSGCNAGLECQGGMCVATAGFSLSANPAVKCYTPCNDGYEGADGIHTCSSEGLMEGCLPGRSCVDPGQCLVPGESPHSCQRDVDCPQFHTCLQGMCRTNCMSSDDCISGAECKQHVCRLSCTQGDDTCPPRDYFCDAAYGEPGVCMPYGDSDVSADQTPPEPFSVQPAQLTFSTGMGAGTVVVTNTSRATASYTVRKLKHTYTDAQDRKREIALAVRGDERRRDIDACTAGTPGCRCRTVNAEKICAPLSSGLALSCDSDDVCHLPSCSGSEPGCVCQGSDCRLICEHPNCPLWWLSLGAEHEGTSLGTSDGVSLSFALASGQSAVLSVQGATGFGQSLWAGQLEVDNGTVRKTVLLRYSERPIGSWTGSIYYFGDFRVDENGLQAWQQGAHDDALVAGIKNGFLQAWARFRTQHFDLMKFRALLTSTRTESWRSAAMREKCGAGRICYPYLNTDGYEVYTFEPDEEPVPSGVVEYPFAMNIAPSAASASVYHGRIDSLRALQYAGNPALDIRFANDPAQCSSEGEAGCMVFMQSFDADIAVGGRYISDACSSRYQPQQVPWLVPGLQAGSTLDAETGRRYRNECRDSTMPLSGSGTADLDRSLAGANPVPDGRERRRHIELVDGALINTDTLFLVFRERVLSLFDNDPANDLVAYGYMVLRRGETDLDETAYQGSVPPTNLGTQTSPAPLACSPTLLAELNSRMGVGIGPSDDPSPLASVLLFGRDTTQTPQLIDEADATGEMVHYLCEETDLFDKGSIATSGDEDLHACPPGSRIIYFSVDRGVISRSTIDGHDCRQHQHDKTLGCKATLLDWQRQGRVLQGQIAPGDADLVWTCQDSNQVYCSTDRLELRAGKNFYKMGQSSQVAFLPLASAVDDAFRYRTRFQNRQGTGLGFVPSLCQASAETVPYCFDPEGIRQAQERIDCLLALYVHRYDELSTTMRDKSRIFLHETLAYDAQRDPDLDTTIYHSGFEKLYVELLVMLGDDGYTKALSSRFDLAGLNVASFEGSLFEPGGINLSGIAGAEMYNLYRATQYYQLGLERFFHLLPALQSALDQGLPEIAGQETVVEYLGRLIRASTQKVKVWSEVSKRYQNFNRPDLARLVIERGYTAAYLESIILTNLMQRIGDSTRPENVAQISKSIQDAQISYRVALTEMRSQYDAISDEINYFGYAPDYIPFPSTEASVARDNGFEVLGARAWQRLQIAQQAEDVALQTTRSFDVDEASFQSELIRVENNYEGQLAELCGTFAAGSHVYPAIRKYAYLDPRAELLGDPCGLMGTGQLHEAMGAIDLEIVDMQKVRVSMDNTIAEAKIEEDRINAACNAVDSFRSTYVSLRDQQDSVQDVIDWCGYASQEADRVLQAAQTIAGLGKCMIVAGLSNGSDCPAAAISATIFGVAIGVNEVAQAALHATITAKQDKLRDLQKQEGQISFDMQCNDDGDGLNQIDSAARVKTINLRLNELQVDALRGAYEMQQAMSRVQQLRQQAKRLQDELEETQQLTINVEAARNNPNVRIYRNDAVINADKTFYSALREVYKATRVYEYYTSQSYARLDQLFLVRMITRGDYNLQNYLIELEDAFREFEDQYGNPDLRVTRLSLRDDIMRIPTLSAVGAPLSQGERIALFRERLQDPAILDEAGYITVPFSSQLDELSPLTRNHKIKYVQAQIIGSDYGDQTARLYLRARGTSAVSSVSDEILYFTFPERTAVINVFFLDQNAFDPTVYRNTRFTDRPYLNTRWELVLNMVDETANQDISLDGMTDIRLYLYYTDFTVF
ncbi:MAG: hypothetical protein ABIJ09_24515 [Pseudomonadota bacterium]